MATRRWPCSAKMLGPSLANQFLNTSCTSRSQILLHFRFYFPPGSLLARHVRRAQRVTHTRETTVEAMMMCVCILNSQDSFDKSCRIVLRKSIKFSYLLTISSTARRLHVRDFSLPLRAPCTQLRPFSFLPPLFVSPPPSRSTTPSLRQFEQFALTCCLHNCSTRD